MPGMSTYDSTKESLEGLLAEIHAGKIQLPEFQRDWVWDDAHVASLLASVTLSYPIGAVMLLQTGGDEVVFKTRPIHGVPDSAGPRPELLVLDGQQRLTALYQAIFSPCPVDTKDMRNKPVKRHYHVAIDEVLRDNGDREEVIVSLPEDRIRRNFRGEVVDDYSTMDTQCTAGMLPLDIVLDHVKLMSWQMRYFQILPDQMPRRIEKWSILAERILNPIKQYQVPIIRLRKETPREAVCQVFEKVNTGGVPLTVFELLTATFAAEGFNLREDWNTRQKALRKFPLLRGILSEDFLQAIALLATRDKRIAALAAAQSPDQAPSISCRRRDILRMRLVDYRNWADLAQGGFVKAAKFLHQHKLFNHRDIPYRTQLVPLAAALAALDHDAQTDSAKQKLARWYWCGVMGELYGSTTETRFARDVPELIAWIKDATGEPSTIVEANFAASRLMTLRTRNSAAYKGVYALLMRSGCLDWRSGETVEVQSYFDEQMDIHHIFPQRWCEDHRIPREKYDSIVNKTALSARTNRIVGGRAPSAYLKALQGSAKINQARMDELLKSHEVVPRALRTDDFEGFFRHRTDALIQLIEAATGKPVVQDLAEEGRGAGMEETEGNELALVPNDDESPGQIDEAVAQELARE